MKRKISHEQIEKKKELMKNLLSLLKSLDENQRQQLAEQFPLINPEGHLFSPANVCLIVFQNENNISLTVLAGFKQWINKGRVVKKGEHGFTIFYPSQKSKNGNSQNADDENATIADNLRYFTTTVFDISQTEELNSDEYNPQNSSSHLSLINHQSAKE